MMKSGQSKAGVFVSNDAKRARDEMAFDTTTPGQMLIEKKRKIERTYTKKRNDEVTVADDKNNDDDTLKLDGINNDCLRHIFEQNLTVPQLVNVAEASGRFIFPAAEAFSRRHCWQKIEVLVTSDPVLNLPLGKIPQLQGAQAMAALNHFGVRMKSILANFDVFETIDCDRRNPIDALILKQCADSLVSFEIHFCIESHFKSIDKPFTKVENLTLNGCMLNANFAQLNRWFPNVVALKLAGLWLPQATVLQTTFEHLTNLSIINDTDSYISPQTIQQMLRLNRQLKSLQLRCNYGVEMVQTIANELRQLEVLELSTPNDLFASFEANQKFTFEMVRIFALHASTYVDYVLKMPFSLKNVHELRLFGLDQFRSQVIDLISSGDVLKMITLLPYQQQWPWGTDEFDALAQAICTRPHLTELELCTDGFEEDGLAQLVGRCKRLERLRLMSLKLDGISMMGLEHDWIVCNHGVKAHSVSMNGDDMDFKFQLFLQMSMQRKQLK